MSLRRVFRGLSAPAPAAALLAVLALLASPARASVSASLDRDSIAPGDTVQLTLERDGQTNAEPDLAPLQQDFDVLGTSRQSSIQIINGNRSSSTQVVVTLAPKHDGRLTVPRIAWGGEQSTPLTLDVSAAAGSRGSGGTNAAANAKVFLKTEIAPKQPYVQAAVHVTVKIYTAETLYRAGLDLPAENGALVQQIGSDGHGSTELNGRHYEVVTRHYLVFPQHSGTLELAGPVLGAEVQSGQSIDPFFSHDPFGGFFGGSSFGGPLTATRPIRLHGDPITLHVRPRPASADAASYWLPALKVSLTGKWNPDDRQAHVGDPLTLNLHLEAEGLTAAQLPDLSALLDVPAGLKMYPDKAKLDNATRNGTLVGSRDQSIALIADAAGRFMLPALSVHWWDTKADAPREATLPARELVILPAVGQPASPPPAAVPAAPGVKDSPPAPTPAGAAPSSGAAASAAPSSPSAGADRTPWRWISLGAVLLWVATLAGWLVSRRRKGSKAASAPKAAPPQTKTEDPRATFRAACRVNDARAARRSLLTWAATSWPDAPPAGLNALAARLRDPERAALLRALDRACYAGGDWQGDAFAAAFGELPVPPSKLSSRDSELEPLYPL
ncbi:MAG TPA: BatD family protein [Gammaproteobacteria bacterium]|nr:BatD family protein [Gammaproteobacteria bacterium]